MSSRLNNIDLNSDAVSIEQIDELNDMDADKFESAVSDAQTLTGEEDKVRLVISDGNTVSDLKLGQADRDESKACNVKMEIESMENKVGFYVNDLVWAKVKSHPWWPGQIFDPSSSSEKAKKHQTGNDRLLLGFFGDKSFAWNEECNVKPYYINFSQMERQSDLGSFHHAIDCSLGEVSRRVQFGLSCSCLPEEVLNKIRTQVVVNGGIREELSRIEVKEDDDRSSVNSFLPLNLMNFVRKHGESPFEGIDRLDYAIAHSQLLAFNYWRGYSQLSEFRTFEGLLDHDEHVQGNSSKKRKGKIHNDGRMLKKEKLISDLISENSSNSKNPSLDEMLFQVRSIAEDPMNNDQTTKSFLRFFSDFRNSSCKDASSEWFIKIKNDDENEQQQSSPTALILNFTDLSSVPPVSNLNKIFGKFGPLEELETKVMKKTKRAKVIFKRRDDAETAFSSAGKYSIFGPALVSYRLTPQKGKE